jgi:hypothetical protein
MSSEVQNSDGDGEKLNEEEAPATQGEVGMHASSEGAGGDTATTTVWWESLNMDAAVDAVFKSRTVGALKKAIVDWNLPEEETQSLTELGESIGDAQGFLIKLLLSSKSVTPVLAEIQVPVAREEVVTPHSLLLSSKSVTPVLAETQVPVAREEVVTPHSLLLSSKSVTPVLAETQVPVAREEVVTPHSPVLSSKSVTPVLAETQVPVAREEVVTPHSPVSAIFEILSAITEEDVHRPDVIRPRRGTSSHANVSRFGGGMDVSRLRETASTPLNADRSFPAQVPTIHFDGVELPIDDPLNDHQPVGHDRLGDTGSSRGAVESRDTLQPSDSATDVHSKPVTFQRDVDDKSVATLQSPRSFPLQTSDYGDVTDESGPSILLEDGPPDSFENSVISGGNMSVTGDVNTKTTCHPIDSENPVKLEFHPLSDDTIEIVPVHSATISEAPWQDHHILDWTEGVNSFERGSYVHDACISAGAHVSMTNALIDDAAWDSDDYLITALDMADSYLQIPPDETAETATRMQLIVEEHADGVLVLGAAPTADEMHSHAYKVDQMWSLAGIQSLPQEDQDGAWAAVRREQKLVCSILF